MDIDNTMSENLEGLWEMVRNTKEDSTGSNWADLIYHYKGVIKAIIESSCIEYIRENAGDISWHITNHLYNKWDGKGTVYEQGKKALNEWVDRQQQEWESK